MTPAIDIIVLNWNGKNDTIECLDSLRQSAYPNRRIIVVDNGSTDDSVAAIRHRFPDVEMVCTGRNLGYAGGNNAGLRHCRRTGNADFHLLLNNDTVVPPDFLRRMVDTAARHPEAALFSPKIYFQHRPHILWFGGGVWNDRAYDFRHLGQGEPDSAAYGEKTRVDYVSGCALFIRADVVDLVGFLDERYFLCFEEVDYCYRARQIGLHSLVSDDADILHKVSSSIGPPGGAIANYFYARNRLLFGEKHLRSIDRICMMVRIVFETVLPRIRMSSDCGTGTLKKIYWLLRKNELFFVSDFFDTGYRANLKGLFDYVMRRFGDCPDSIRRPR